MVVNRVVSLPPSHTAPTQKENITKSCQFTTSTRCANSKQKKILQRIASLGFILHHHLREYPYAPRVEW